MTNRELMQMALKELEKLCNTFSYPPDSLYDIINALRATLAQPEPLAQFKFQEYGPPNWGESQVTKPEFVAEQKAMNEGLRKMVEQKPMAYDINGATVYIKPPVYTAPPQREWVGLTFDEIDDIAADAGYGYIDVARAIEAKLKEKNAC